MFGKYTSIEAFLEAFTRESLAKQMDQVHSLPVERQPKFLNTLAFKDIVEITATVLKRLPDDTSAPRHYQLDIAVSQVIATTAKVKADLLECKNKKLPVFLAIRYGDRQGIIQPISKGLDKGNKLHLKGQWISREDAYEHGGEKMSVLHFTHHPAGFTCTAEKCYS